MGFGFGVGATGTTGGINCFFCSTPATKTTYQNQLRNHDTSKSLIPVYLPGSPGALKISANATGTETQASSGFLLLCHLLSIEPNFGDPATAGSLGQIENLWVCEAKCAPFLISLQYQVGLYQRVKMEIGKIVGIIQNEISWSLSSGAGDMDFEIDSLRQALAFSEDNHCRRNGSSSSNTTTDVHARINWNLLDPSVLSQLNLGVGVEICSNTVLPPGSNEDHIFMKTEPEEDIDQDLENYESMPEYEIQPLEVEENDFDDAEINTSVPQVPGDTNRRQRLSCLRQRLVQQAKSKHSRRVKGKGFESRKKPTGGQLSATCSACGKKFTRTDSLRYHEKSVHGIGGTLERKHKCTICEWAFYKKVHLTAHLKSHKHKKTGAEPKNRSQRNENGRSKCHFCTKTFRSSHNRKSHEQRNHNLPGADRPPISTQQVDMMDSDSKPQISHKNPFQCTQCPQICRTAWALGRHELIKHSKQESWPCTDCEPNCPTTWPTIYKLWEHKREAHSSGPKFNCDRENCLGKIQTFISLGRLKKHNRLYHNASDSEEDEYDEDGQKKNKELPKRRALCRRLETPLPCPNENCSRTFPSQWNLELHIKRIHQRGLIQCTKCTKTVKTEDEMKEHLWLHEERERRKIQRSHRPPRYRTSSDPRVGPDERRRHKCSYCDKMWLRPVDARRHEDAVHKKLLPHLCEMCGKGFRRMYGLWIHMKTVHDQTTWTQQISCEFCPPGRFFSSIGWWEAHLKKFHGNEPNVQEVTYQYSK